MREPFEVSTVPTFLDGLFMAVNAMPDAWLVLDSPDGCYLKWEKLAYNHDLTSTLFHPLGRHRLAHTGIRLARLAFGTEKEVRKLIRRIAREERPAIIFLSEVSMVLVTSNDLRTLAQEMTLETKVPVVYVAPRTFDGDWLDGYQAALGGLAKVVGSQEQKERTQTEEGSARTAVIIGLMADRTEGEARGNSLALQDLMKMAGYDDVKVWLDGSPVASLARAPIASLIVKLPGFEEMGDGFLKSDKTIECHLPLGIAQSSAFVRRVAEASHSIDVAETRLAQTLSRTVPLVERARSRYLAGREIVIAAEPAWAIGLMGFLSELGAGVPLVAVRTRREARVELVRKVARELGFESEIIFDYSTSGFEKALDRCARTFGCDAIIGTTAEREAAWRRGLGFVEFGYPSFVTHALAPRPFLGFDGAIRLCEELVNAVCLTDYERNARSGLPKP